MLIVRPVGAATGPVSQWQWVRSRNGLAVDAHGTDASALLPRDNDLVLLVPAHCVSWHRVQLPRVPASRVRLALHGVLEERLLADPAHLHLALAPDFEVGRPGWVAAVDKAHLSAWLGLLQAAGRPAARIVPEVVPWPDVASPTVQLQAWAEADRSWVALSSPLGVLCVPLPESPAPRPDLASDLGAGLVGLAGHTAALPLPEQWTCWSEPTSLAQVQTLTGLDFRPEPPAQRCLRCAQSDWDLAQFDLKLSAHARRSQRLHQAWRHVLHSRPWRAARWGVWTGGVGAVLLVAGLTWQETQVLAAKQQRIRQTLTEVFPHITLVLDAPLQMQREVAQLQRTRGSLSAADVEVLLHDLAPLVPPHALVGIEVDAAVTRLRFAPGAEAALRAASDVLQQRGWRVQSSGLQLEARREAQAS